MMVRVRLLRLVGGTKNDKLLIWRNSNPDLPETVFLLLEQHRNGRKFSISAASAFKK